MREIVVDATFAKGFLLGGLVSGPAVGAAIGATVPTVSNDFEWIDAWTDTWVGDALGVLVVAPAVLVLVVPLPRSAAPRLVDIAVAGTVIIVIIVLGVLLLATDGEPLGYVAIPLLAWVALRMGPIGLAVASVLLASLATAAKARERGPWPPTDGLTAHEQLERQQFFLLVAIGGARLLVLEARHRIGAVEGRWPPAPNSTGRSNGRSSWTKVQRSLLPRRRFSDERIAVAGAYLPASDALQVGGDWYLCCDVPTAPSTWSSVRSSGTAWRPPR
jgi:MASE1